MKGEIICKSKPSVFMGQVGGAGIAVVGLCMS